MYGPIVTDHFRNPRNLGRLDAPDGVGQVDDPGTDTFVTVNVRLERSAAGGATIAEARFRALGCSACIATGSMATELARGHTVNEALAIDAAAILAALAHGIPEDQRYCADLAARALHQALMAASDAASRS
ncbi:MAG: iron-sulfur cluster assembly scaffold protein [Chloroflexota bacterium]|nr:iron-sulfur cluster assembly scaffold protein [Chloroflexota bacterium]